MLKLRAAPGLTRPRPARRRRAARGAVLSGLLAVVAFNLGLGAAAERHLGLRDPGYGDKARQLVPLARANAGNADLVVMLGTSRAGFGFHGEKFERRVLEKSGRKVVAYNFGVPASGPITHLVYARRLAKAGVVPKRLYLEVLPSMIADRPGGPLEQLWVFGDRLTYSELPAVEGYGFDPENVRAKWRISTLTPWYGLRFQLLGRVVQSWIPWHLRYDWGRGGDIRGWSTPIAAEVTAEQAAAGSFRAAGEYGPVLGTLTPGGGACRAFEDTVREAQARGTEVTLVWMPEGSTFRQLYPPAVEARVREYLARVCARYGCGLIDARLWVPDDQFTDGHHLLRGGAAIFTERLADTAGPP